MNCAGQAIHAAADLRAAVLAAENPVSIEVERPEPEQKKVELRRPSATTMTNRWN